MTPDNSLINSVSGVFSSAGIPQSVWGPIMTVESNGNPDATQISSIEHSVGLFQLNSLNGLGKGYTDAQLKDPVTNATIASKAMAPAYTKGVSLGLTGYSLTQYVANNSGWPLETGTSSATADYDTKLAKAYGSPTATIGVSNVANSVGTTTTSSTSVSTKGLLNQLVALEGIENGTGLLGLPSVESVAIQIIFAVIGGIIMVFGFILLTRQGAISGADAYMNEREKFGKVIHATNLALGKGDVVSSYKRIRKKSPLKSKKPEPKSPESKKPAPEKPESKKPEPKSPESKKPAPKKEGEV